MGRKTLMAAWGRIFFIYGGQEAPGTLQAVYGQPLENHVGNCARLFTHLQEILLSDLTRDKLETAVRLHDRGKRETFRLFKDPETKRWTYSFAGHRFRVPHEDPYVAGLIRSHHEFSVERIQRERALLKGPERDRFADDLYLLCMVDQLEAELAVKEVEGAKDVARTFMEFVTRRDGRDGSYRVEPWPFKGNRLSLELLLYPIPLEFFRDSSKEQPTRLVAEVELKSPKIVSITMKCEEGHGH
jgi:hypothetical protein